MTSNCDEIARELPEKYSELWVKLVRAGHDLYRDHVSTPGFMSIFPEVKNKKGLDVGCGEGYNTRLIASKGANMTGIDISPTFVKYASEASQGEISYSVQDATKLNFPDDFFDFTVSFFALLEIIDFKKAIEEIFRVTAEGGFFQFCITHPCFWHPKLNWLRGRNQEIKGLITNDYFQSKNEISKWMFDGVDPQSLGEQKFFETTFVKRTLSVWINALLECGFIIEKIHEPKPSTQALRDYPTIYGSSIVPFFLIIRCVKK